MGASQSTRKITLVNDDKAGVIKLSESLAYRLRGQIEGQQSAAAAEPSPPPSPAPPPVAAIPQVPEPPRIPQIAPEPFVPEPAPAPVFVPEPAPAPPKEPTPVFVPEPAPAPVFVPEPAPAPVFVPEPAPVFVPEPPRVEVSGAADTTPEKLIPIPIIAPSVPEIPEVTTSVELPVKAATESQPDVGVAVRAGSVPTLSQPGGSIPPWSIYAEEAHLMVMRLREEKEQEVQQLNRDWREKMDAREQEFSKMSQLSEEEVNTAIKDVEKLFVKASCSPVCQDHQESVMTCYQDHPRQGLRCARQVEDFARCVDLSRLQSVLRQRAN